MPSFASARAHRRDLIPVPSDTGKICSLFAGYYANVMVLVCGGGISLDALTTLTNLINTHAGGDPRQFNHDILYMNGGTDICDTKTRGIPLQGQRLKHTKMLAKLMGQCPNAMVVGPGSANNWKVDDLTNIAKNIAASSLTKMS